MVECVVVMVSADGFLTAVISLSMELERNSANGSLWTEISKEVLND